MICICILGGAGAFFFLNKKGVLKNKEVIDKNQQTANEFINVKDIRNEFLYTIDGYIMCYVKINPISIDLYSKNEKRTFMKQLTAELSAVQQAFKFIAVSQPVDISDLVTELSCLMSGAEQIQKELLKQELAVMNTYTSSGEVVQRQFYICVYEKYIEDCERNILSKAKEFSVMFGTVGVNCEIIREDEIIKLIGLINNPAYAHLEDTEYEDSMPLIMEK